MEILDLKNKIKVLDTLRGFAAIYVLICHAAWQIWDYNSALKNTEIYSLSYYLYYFIIQLLQFAHFSVLFFFILSGFVIHLKHAQNLKLNPEYKVEISSFYKNRFLRIYPPLLFALVLTIVLDFLMKLSNFQANYPVAYDKIYEYPLDNNLSNFLGNVFLLNESYFPSFGSNNPLWSLMYEWWFYILYPVLFYLSKKITFLKTTIIISLLFFICNYTNIFPEKHFNLIFSKLILWWIGCLIAELYVHEKLNSKLYYFSALSFFSLLLFRIKIMSSVLIDLSFCIGTIGIFSCILLNPRLLLNRKLNALCFLGNFSLTLYLIHMPLLKFFSSKIIQSQNLIDRPNNIIYLVLTVPFIILISWALHFLIEKKYYK